MQHLEAMSQTLRDWSCITAPAEVVSRYTVFNGDFLQSCTRDPLWLPTDASLSAALREEQVVSETDGCIERSTADCLFVHQFLQTATDHGLVSGLLRILGKQCHFCEVSVAQLSQPSKEVTWIHAFFTMSGVVHTADAEDLDSAAQVPTRLAVMTMWGRAMCAATSLMGAPCPVADCTPPRRPVPSERPPDAVALLPRRLRAEHAVHRVK